MLIIASCISQEDYFTGSWRNRHLTFLACYAPGSLAAWETEIELLGYPRNRDHKTDCVRKGYHEKTYCSGLAKMRYISFVDFLQENSMHRSGFEPELLAWKAKVIATRPSVQVSLRCIKGYKKLYLKQGFVTKLFTLPKEPLPSSLGLPLCAPGMLHKKSVYNHFQLPRTQNPVL